TEADHRRVARYGQPRPVPVDDAAPMLPEVHSSLSPSTRITLATARTTSMAPRSATQAASAASGAAWVTMTSWASSPRPSWRTALIDTSWWANASATRASTPGLSATSREMWYLVSACPMG